MLWPVPVNFPLKPLEATIAISARVQPACAPSELETPATARAASSASAARAHQDFGRRLDRVDHVERGKFAGQLGRIG